MAANPAVAKAQLPRCARPTRRRQFVSHPMGLSFTRGGEPVLSEAEGSGIARLASEAFSSAGTTIVLK
jgi:hypothetical protein